MAVGGHRDVHISAGARAPVHLLGCDWHVREVGDLRHEEMRKSVRKLYTDPPPHPPTTAHGTVCFAPLRVWLCNTAPAAHEGASQLANALGTRLGCEKSAERTLASKSHPEPNC